MKLENEKLSKSYLLEIANLSIEDVYLIFSRAQFFIDNYRNGLKYDYLKGVTVALVFFEASTRTKLSFELAAKRLSADTLSFQSSSSSVTKGESLIDTLRTIESMGVQIYIVRHACSGVPVFLQSNTKGLVINAGDGKHEHPTQALLDAFTLYRHFGTIEGLKVSIIGDIFHSRVARSNIHLLTKLGVKVYLHAPGTLLPQYTDMWDIEIIDNLEEVIALSDALILLRLQRERMESGLLPTMREYSKYYGISKELFESKPELILLHPGPVNYGIELDYRISSYPNVLIQTQVTHGVFIRMALLSLLAGHVSK